MGARVRKKASDKISLFSRLYEIFKGKAVTRNKNPSKIDFIPVTARRTNLDYLYIPKDEQEFTKKNLIGMTKNWYEISPENYFELYERKKKYQSDFDFTGVYLIHNLNLDKYYVGQSVHVLKRLGQHFTGKGGNPDVFFDYRSGYKFTIQTISLTESKYQSLNRLEKDAIDCYSAFDQGYNNTIGNKD